ncbi:beta-ketoacyl synthase N-terminal-like domain-containing protein [Streptomyces sp. M19]
MPDRAAGRRRQDGGGLGLRDGDAATLDAGSRLLVAGQPHNPLLFMQSTANAVLGRLSCDFGITGPLLSLSTADDLAGELLVHAELLLEDEEVDRVVLVGVELAATPRTAAAHRGLGTVAPAADRAVALVLDRGDPYRTRPMTPRQNPTRPRPRVRQPPRPGRAGRPIPRNDTMIAKDERALIIEDAALGAGNVIHRLKAYGRPMDERVLWTDGTWQAPDGDVPTVLTLGELHEIVEIYAGWYHARGSGRATRWRSRPGPAPSSRSTSSP